MGACLGSSRFGANRIGSLPDRGSGQKNNNAIGTCTAGGFRLSRELTMNGWYTALPSDLESALANIEL